MSLRRRVLWGTLAVAAAMLVVGFAGAAAMQRAAESGRRTELARQGETTAQLVEEALESGPLRRAAAVADVLATVRSVGGHDFVEAALRGPNGALSILGSENRLLAEVPPGGLDQPVAHVDVDGSPVLATLAVVETAGRGDILIAIGRIEPPGVGASVGTAIMVALGVGAVLAVILALWLSAALGRRLDRLANAARAYAAGDFEVRLDSEGDRELAAVAAAFNEMADRLDASRAREHDFLLSVGHDLRTPLTTIRGYAEGLASGDLPAADLARVGTVLESQATRLARLVEDLMMLARLEADEFTLDPELVELGAHIEGVVDGSADRARLAGIRLDSDINDVGYVEVDADRVAQIAGNLLDNAIRYTPEQGAVTVRLDVADGAPMLSVEDTGPGIDPLDLPHVFERLYVAQRYRPVRPEGSGLGLSIVKALADSMGARVAVESRVGEGTVARVWFVAGEVRSDVPTAVGIGVTPSSS